MKLPIEVANYLALNDYISDNYDDMLKEDNELLCKVLDYLVKTIYKKGYDKYFDGEE